jgi:hypothetical protein
MPAFLSIGGKMFRLNPAGESNSQLKVLERMRKGAVTAITTQREAMLAAAKRESEIVRNQIAGERALLDHDREVFRREQGDRFIIPDWLIGYPVIRSDRTSSVVVQLRFNFQPTEFSIHSLTWHSGDPDDDDRAQEEHYGDYRWRAIDAEPFMAYFWLKFDLRTGVYALENAYMDAAGGVLPHANHGQFCCQPQGLPERINGGESLQRVIRAVERTFKVVNLGSLLTNIRDWRPEVLAFVPDGLREWLPAFGVEDGTPNPVDYGAVEIPTERGNQIWEAPETAHPRRRP